MSEVLCGSGIGAVGDVCDAAILTLNLRRHSELGTPGEFGVLWFGIVSYRFGVLVTRLPPQSQRRKPPRARGRLWQIKSTRMGGSWPSIEARCDQMISDQLPYGSAAPRPLQRRMGNPWFEAAPGRQRCSGFFSFNGLAFQGNTWLPYGAPYGNSCYHTAPAAKTPATIRGAVW